MKKLVLVAISALGLVGSACAKLDFTKAAKKAGKAIEVAKAIPGLAVKGAETGGALVKLGGVIIGQVPGLHELVAKAKAAKTDEEKTLIAVDIIDKLLPIMIQTLPVLEKSSATIGAIGTGVVQPFKESAGKKMGEGGNKAALAAKTLKEVSDTFYKALWPKVSVTIKDLAKKEKAAKAKAKQPGLVPAA